MSPCRGFMIDLTTDDAELDSVADLLVSLGGISPDRVRCDPALGTATVDDVIRVRDTTGRICELVDGTLVEKIMGAAVPFIAGQVLTRMNDWNREHSDAGMILVVDGAMALREKLVRVPDLSFTNWDRVPGRVVPAAPVPDLAPDLAVEVLSEGNTRDEMERKLKEYFLSEVELVWYIDPRTRTVRVFTSPDDVTELGTTDVLDGGAVLPGFSVPVASLFEDLAPAPETVKPPKNGEKKPKKRK